MRPGRTAAVLAILGHAWSCQPADDPDAGPHPLLGTWRIEGRHMGGIAAMSEEDASAWHRRTFRLTADAMWGPGFRCEPASYHRVEVATDSLLSVDHGLSRAQIGPGPDSLPVPDRVTRIQVDCGGEGPAGPGRIWIGVSADRALVPWDGVLFELVRVPDEAWVDFRATGQEPGWVLQITLGGEIDFTYLYGEERVTVPTPSPEVAVGEAALRFEATAAGGPLRIDIEPQPCHDGMSGAAYETRVVVTFQEVAYGGCGGPLPPGLAAG